MRTFRICASVSGAFASSANAEPAIKANANATENLRDIVPEAIGTFHEPKPAQEPAISAAESGAFIGDSALEQVRLADDDSAVPLSERASRSQS